MNQYSIKRYIDKAVKREVRMHQDGMLDKIKNLVKTAIDQIKKISVSSLSQKLKSLLVSALRGLLIKIQMNQAQQAGFETASILTNLGKLKLAFKLIKENKGMSSAVIMLLRTLLSPIIKMTNSLLMTAEVIKLGLNKKTERKEENRKELTLKQKVYSLLKKLVFIVKRFKKIPMIRKISSLVFGMFALYNTYVGAKNLPSAISYLKQMNNISLRIRDMLNHIYASKTGSIGPKAYVIIKAISKILGLMQSFLPMLSAFGSFATAKAAGSVATGIIKSRAKI